VNYPALLQQLMPEAILVISALGLIAVAVGKEAKGWGTISEEMAIGLSAGALILAAFFAWRLPVGEAESSLLALDSMGRLGKLLILGLGWIAILLPTAKSEIVHRGEYYALILFALTGLLLAVGTTHLLMLFVALELASLSLYLLAGFSQTARSSEASLKYFLFGGVSAAFQLFGLSLIYGFSHTVELEGVAAFLTQNGASPLAMTGLAMVVVGIAFKLAVAPFHFWAPDVYEGAPSTSVGLIAAASKVVGLLVLVRILMTGFPWVGGSAEWGLIEPGWSPWLAVLAAISILLGNLLALVQKSVRRLLAYSAVANAGYLLAAMSANGLTAVGSALFYVVVYGLATLGALAVVAAVERDQGGDAPQAFAGLVHRSPFQALTLLASFMSLAGVPPFAGFVGKFALFSTAMAATRNHGSAGLTWLIGLAAVMSAVSLYYYLSVLKQAFVDEGNRSFCQHLTLPHRLAIGVPATLLVVLGMFPALLLDPIVRAVAETLSSR
jgi:NADH-quinone oxidoreductase subunit N